MSGVEVTALVGVLVAAAGAVATWVKLPQDKDALYITTTQGATKILHDLADTLYGEIERQGRIIKERDETIANLTLRITQLELENTGLRAKYGTRFSDPSPPPTPTE